MNWPQDIYRSSHPWWHVAMQSGSDKGLKTSKQWGFRTIFLLKMWGQKNKSSLSWSLVCFWKRLQDVVACSRKMDFFFHFFHNIFVFACCEKGRESVLLECWCAEGECESCMHEGHQPRNSTLWMDEEVKCKIYWESRLLLKGFPGAFPSTPLVAPVHAQEVKVFGLS